MFLRIRWFIMGAAASLGVVGYLAAQLRKARTAMTPKNITRSGLRGVANVFDSAADAVHPESGQQ